FYVNLGSGDVGMSQNLSIGGNVGAGGNITIGGTLTANQITGAQWVTGANGFSVMDPSNNVYCVNLFAWNWSHGQPVITRDGVFRGQHVDVGDGIWCHRLDARGGSIDAGQFVAHGGNFYATNQNGLFVLNPPGNAWQPVVRLWSDNNVYIDTGVDIY